MASNFGVQLKKPDGAQSGTQTGNTKRPYGIRKEFQSKPMSDIKAMFEKGGEGDSAKPPEPGTNYAKKINTTQKQTSTTAIGTKTSAIKTKSTDASSIQKREAFQKSDELSLNDLAAFDMLKHEIERKGVDHLDDDEDGLQPAVAVAKVYDGGQAYKATVEKKNVSKTNSAGGSTEVSKSNAASMLSFGLTKLRTRPGSFSTEEKNPQTTLSEKTDSSEIQDGNTEMDASKEKSAGLGVAKIKSVEKKYVSGAPKGWKSNADEKDKRSSPLLDDKIKSDVTDMKNEHRSVVRPVSPVTRTSSSDSSVGNLSPRGYKSTYTKDPNCSNSPRSALKADVNKAVKPDSSGKFIAAKVGQTNKVNEPKTDGNKDLQNLRSKLKPTGALNKDDKTNNKTISNTANFTSRDTKLNEKNKANMEGKIIEHQRISSTSSTESSSSLSKSDSLGLKPKIDRFGSPDLQKKTAVTNSKSTDLYSKQKPEYVNIGKVELRKKDFTSSRRMSAEKFQDLKKGFEKPKENKEQTVELQKKVGIIPAKKILEKRESFENPDCFNKKEIKKEIASPISRKKLLERKDSFEHPERHRKRSEPSEIVTPSEKGRVLQTIKSLNELDEAAKAKPGLKRRSRSLTSSGMEDDVDSSGYYEDVEHEHGPYYHDIHGVRYPDDASNEGDISSEADVLYEEIPALKGKDTKFNNRRATAFKKKKRNTSEELILPNDKEEDVDADVDSDSYSSDNSGIYEDVSGHDSHLFQIGESDSPDNNGPSAIPPGRTPQKKKKKKEGRTSKAIYARFKQAIKGKESKGTDNTEGALKAVVGSGLVGAPQSAGVLDKFKRNLRKAKSSDSSLVSLENTGLNQEEIPVCNSDGSDSDICMEMEQPSSKSQSLERSDEGSTATPPPVPPPPGAPPLPPRTSALHRASSAGDHLGVDYTDKAGQRRLSSTADLRSGGTSPRDTKTEPPLPPRNRVSQNLDLNLVVPVAPGGGDMRRSGWPPAKDSYLHGQKITSPTDLPYMDDSPIRGPELSPPPLPDVDKRSSHSSSRSSRSSIPDEEDKPPPLPNRPAPKQPLTGKDSYVCVDPPDEPRPDLDYSLADEIRRELERRPVSSGYIQAHDLANIPEPKSIIPPFEDVLKFKSQYEEDGLYIDLSDDQVYGTMGNRYQSKLESESLYQFYNKDKISRASKRRAIYAGFDDSDEEEYDNGGDKIYEHLSNLSSGSSPTEDEAPKKISTLEMFGKSGTVLRALWAEMPEVKTSGVLDTISAHERKMQESMFEIITSEATYLKSLNVLINVFLLSKEFGSDHAGSGVLTKQERHVVFSNIGTIRDASEQFLSDLESRWQESVVISDVCDIIKQHAAKNFECYVHYCSNQTFQDRAVTALKKKQDFSEALRRLESATECQGLPMISFLLLPMQRITRLPLLVDAICHRMDPINDKHRHTSAIKALDALNRVVKRCNDGAKKMQQTEQMCLIAKQLDFRNKDMTQIPLISSSRYLVKQGELTRIMSDSGSRLPFGKAKAGKQNTYVFLFNDILLITKKKGNQYVVTDYSMRNAIHVETLESPEKVNKYLPLGVPGGCKNLFLLVMLENYDKKMVECVFACNSPSDKSRWMEAVTPVKVSEDHERIYEEWDCPQVQCVKKYVPTEPDELALEESDVVNVFKKLEDGWYEGERMRDSERGWFPKEHVVEIVNSHVRARNLRMKYRLMQVSEQNER